MIFSDNNTEEFIHIFEERKDTIKSFPGCIHLELWQDTNDKTVFFTYSVWESEKHLDHYRFSPFFKETWSLTKVLFKEKPEAWSFSTISKATGLS